MNILLIKVYTYKTNNFIEDGLRLKLDYFVRARTTTLDSYLISTLLVGSQSKGSECPAPFAVRHYQVPLSPPPSLLTQPIISIPGSDLSFFIPVSRGQTADARTAGGRLHIGGNCFIKTFFANSICLNDRTNGPPAVCPRFVIGKWHIGAPNPVSCVRAVSEDSATHVIPGLVSSTWPLLTHQRVVRQKVFSFRIALVQKGCDGLKNKNNVKHFTQAYCLKLKNKYRNLFCRDLF